MFEPTAGRLQLDINSLLVNINLYIQTAMLGTREYTFVFTFRANVHNSSFPLIFPVCENTACMVNDATLP